MQYFAHRVYTFVIELKSHQISTPFNENAKDSTISTTTITLNRILLFPAGSKTELRNASKIVYKPLDA